MARRKRPAPRSFSDDWPTAACTDPSAEKIRLLALRLHNAMDGSSIRSVAAKVNMDHSAVADLLAGRSWPDTQTLGLLEIALNSPLWPPHGRTDHEGKDIRRQDTGH